MKVRMRGEEESRRGALAEANYAKEVTIGRDGVWTAENPHRHAQCAEYQILK